MHRRRQPELLLERETTRRGTARTRRIVSRLLLRLSRISIYSAALIRGCRLSGGALPLGMSAEGRVPARGVHVVEYPGVVVNADAALDTLGGAQAVAQALRGGGGGGQLHLRFRPRDPLCHPLIGARAAVAPPGTAGNALLLRLRTPPSSGNSNSAGAGTTPAADHLPLKAARPRLRRPPARPVRPAGQAKQLSPLQSPAPPSQAATDCSAPRIHRAGRETLPQATAPAWVSPTRHSSGIKA